MKAAVMTLHASPNYGSCLQTWATQWALGRMGWDSIVIDYCRPNSRPEKLVEGYFTRPPLSRVSLVWKLPGVRPLVRPLLSGRVKLQGAPFERFRESHLRLSRKYSSWEELRDDPPKADAYITGSDQVWNSVWNGGFEPAMYLEFAPKDKPRIAFSASIGRESIDEDERPRMSEALARYDAVSLREASGIEIAKSLGRQDAVQVLDPTLLLTRGDWEAIASVPCGLPTRYLLTYQLGKSDVFYSYAERTANQLNLPIVALCHAPGVRHKGALNYVSPEVTDFLGLFMNADYVVTDSFHATAFSLNLNIPFTSLQPDRFATRISSILELTGMQDRLLSEGEDVAVAANLDFSFVRSTLDQEREKTLDYLKNALGGAAARAEETQNERQG